MFGGTGTYKLHLVTWQVRGLYVAIHMGIDILRGHPGGVLPLNVCLHKNLVPKDPGMSWDRDFPYNPILGMGLRPSILL